MSLFEIYYKDRWEFKNINLNLLTIDNALKEVDFSQKNLGRIIHIAGTNGKGSTAFFLAQILNKYGIRTALFTSPHILDIKERLKINLKNISAFDFDAYFNRYACIIKKYNLSYFESIFFISLIWFTDKKPKVTIIETGLGGTLDATNTSLISDKICVITSISQDHVNILGKNIYSIIKDKLGIVRENSKVFLGINKPFILEYIKKHVKLDNLEEIRLSEFATNNYPFPYCENYSTAKQVAEYILYRNIDNMENLDLPPCRLEKIDNIILDGSHNASGLLSLKKSKIIDNNTTIIFTSTKDRDLLKTFKILSTMGNNIILTSISDKNRSITKKEASKIPCTYIENSIEALEKVLQSEKSKNIIITGSFYLCSTIKKYYKDMK